MSDAQLPLSLAQRHRNQQLFADRYLDVILPARPAWLALRAEAAPILARLQALFAAFTPSSNEAQTEHDLVRPVLAALGHDVEVQAALRTPLGTKRPDYVFFHDQATLEAHKNRVLDDAVLATTAYAIGDAKYWERNLDVRADQEQADISRVPAGQIAFYMRHSGVGWGILTNGRRWRLYHRATVEKQDRFYEVDLLNLVEAGDGEAFLYFYAFFRRAAFAPPLDDALTLEGMLAESVDYARDVSDNLKAQVFDALRNLAQGFLDYPANRLDATPETLDAIYRNCLIVLYRMLFVFYAEARGLLPLRESADYRGRYSLYALARDAAQQLDAAMLLLPASSGFWARLRDLFQIINAGSPPLKVATFNGGLFDPERHPFLERYTIGDRQLIQAIDRLARVRGQFIDYRDLAERHLGTIYEGLLEHHLLATEPSPDGFRVDLFNDKGERHRSGSYYTPDFVVQYIVEQTLQPVLDAAVAGAPTDAAKIQAVLAINVCDPAMGSGHFPVAAMEYIARYLLDLGVQPEPADTPETDLLYWKRRVAQSCIYGVDLNPLAVDLAKLSLWLATAAKDRPLSFLDHHLRCGNALVGTRAAAMQPAPAPQRRRARRQEQQAREAGQISMLDDPAFARSMSTAVDSMWLIERTAGNTLAEVKEQEQIYARLRAELLQRQRRLADAATATQLGVRGDPALWNSLRDYVLGRALAAPKPVQTWLEQATARAEELCIFHWDLEFPEVFFDQHGQPRGAAAGFDAVIGNPPYVRQEQLGPFKDYFKAVFAETYSGTADLFVYFFQQGVQLLREGGRLAYIASNSWLRANYATPLRIFMREHVTIEQLIDLGDNRVFADAPDVYPAIPVVRRTQPPAEHIAQVAVFNRGEGVKHFNRQVTAKQAPVSIHDQDDSGWQLEDDSGRKILSKIVSCRQTLGNTVEGRILFGIKTGLNKAFIIDYTTRERLLERDHSCAALIKPILRGEDLRPWHSENDQVWLIEIPNGWTQRTFGYGVTEETAWEQFRIQYPALAEHLQPFAESGRKRGDKGEYWWELRPCDYYAAFETPKIFWPDIAKFPRFVWDDQHTRIGNTAYFIPNATPYLLGILSSRVEWFVIARLSQSFGERAGVERFRLFTQTMERLPIPNAPAAERDAIGDLAMRITAEAQARYERHRRARRRILADLGSADGKLNQKLTAWWNLDFAAFRREISKVFKHDIPLRERDDWEDWLTTQVAAHQRHTAAIIALETELNTRVYTLFDLSPPEIAIIETSTRYQYGEV